MKKFFFLNFFLLPSASYSLTFDEALNLSHENSHDLKILELESQVAAWSETKAWAGYLPHLELDGRHLTQERFEELEVPFGTEIFVTPAIQPYTSLGATATWNVFNGWETTSDWRAAQQEKTAAELRLQRAEESHRAEIRTLFYKALASEILVDVANQNIQTLQSHLSDVGARIRSGVSTRYDSLRVEVQLEDARTEKMAAESSVVIARSRLFQAVGRADDGHPLVGKLPDDFSKVDLQSLKMETGLRKDRTALLADIERSQSLAKSARSHWFPSVSLFGSYEWYNNINHSISESDNRFKSAYALGLKFNWNLFDGGSHYASQNQALLNQKIQNEKLAKLDQSLPTDLEEAKRRFAYDVVNYNAKLSSIRKAEEAVRLARGGLRAGTRTNTEILDAVVDLNRARAAAIKSQVDAIEALGQLELTVGHSLSLN